MLARGWVEGEGGGERVKVDEEGLVGSGPDVGGSNRCSVKIPSSSCDGRDGRRRCTVSRSREEDS